MRIQPWTHDQLMAREDVFEALCAKAVKMTVRTVVSQLRDGVLTAAAPPAPAVSYTATEAAVMATWTGYVNSQLYPYLTETFTTSAERAAEGAAEATGTVVDVLTNAYASEYLQYAYNRMVATGEEVWRLIRTELSAGFEAGDSIAEIAARLTQVAGLATPRALTVARTEVVSAANAGSYLQMLDAGFTETVTKVWLATEGDRTRLSHRHADDQAVELSDEFSVDIYNGDVKTGTEGLEFPGDPTGTPGNIINCRCSLAFEFSDDDEDDEVMTAAKTFKEKDHPRDKDGQFKKKGAPDMWSPGDPAPTKDSPTIDKIKFIVHEKLGSLSAVQKIQFVDKIKQDEWNELTSEEKEKISSQTMLNPENSHKFKKKIAKLEAGKGSPNVKQAIEDMVKEAVSAKSGRPLGGVNTKTGKALKPGSPTALKVQLLYNTTFENGAVMAVKKDTNERVVWNGDTNKVQRQVLKDGKWFTTESLSRGDTYKKYNKEEGWTVPEASSATAAGADAAPAVAPGKPIALKVQVLYNAKYDAGQTIAERVGSGERLVWNGKKIERQTFKNGSWTTTDTVTRGKAYQLWKDEDGWTTPTGAVGANEPDDEPDTDVPAPYVAPKSVGGENTDKIINALNDTSVPDGTVLWSGSGFGTTSKITKLDDGIAEVEHSPYAGVVGKSKFYAEDANTEHILKAIATAKQNALDNEKAKVEVGQDVDDDENVAPEASQDVLPAQSTSPFQTVTKIGTGAEWQDALDSMKVALNDDKVPNGTVLFKHLNMSITKTNEDVALLKTAMGEKHIYTDDLTPNGFIQNVLMIDKPPVPSAAPVTKKVPGKNVKDSDIAYVDDNFGAALIGDVLLETDAVTIEKANEDDVSLNMKDDLGGFTTYNIDELTADKVNDFIEINEPDEETAPPSPHHLDNTAANLVNAVESPVVLPLDTILENPEYHVLKISDKGVQVINNSTFQSKILKKERLNGATLADALESVGLGHLAGPNPPKPTKLTASQVDTIKAKVNDINVPALKVLFQNDDFQIVKGNGAVGIFSLDGPGYEQVELADLTPESLDEAIAKLDTTPSAANVNVTVTDKPLTPSVAPTSPIQMSYGLLVNPKTTGKYTDGQMIAFHPESEDDAGDELLIWNGKTKKFEVFTRTTNPPGDWQKVFSYTKQGAYKNLKNDTGWTTVPANVQNPAGTAVPVVDGGSSAPSISTPAPSTGKTPKFSTVQLNAAAQSKVDALTPEQVKSIYGDFRQKPSGSSYDVVRLTSPGEDVLEAVLRAQAKYQKNNPGQTLNMLETIKAVDVQASKDAGVANNNLFEKKLLEWLETPDGKKKAPQVLHEFRLSPAEKKKLEADKKAAEKAKLDAQLKDFHEITAGLSKPSTTDTEFLAQTPQSVYDAQKPVLDKTPWTASQRAALKKYTGSYYHTVNNMLRGLSTPTPQTIEDAKEIQKGMRPLAKSMLLFRGLGAVDGLLPGNIAEYKDLIGKTFVEPAFSSTSTNNPFGGKIKLEIEVPAGTPAAYVQPISHFASENEVLLAAGTKFQFISAKENGYNIVVRVRVVP